jgi:hypothetical protein
MPPRQRIGLSAIAFGNGSRARTPFRAIAISSPLSPFCFFRPEPAELPCHWPSYRMG